MRDVLSLVPAAGDAAGGGSMQGPLAPGDEVTFYGITATSSFGFSTGSTADSSISVGVALYPQMAPRAKEKDGIVFKRTVNSDLKAHIGSFNEQLASAGGSISGFSKPQGIVMAKGPNEDGSAGFPAGWRAAQLFALEAKKPLPWRHLLSYEPRDYAYPSPSDVLLSAVEAASSGGAERGGGKSKRRAAATEASTAAAAASVEHPLSLHELERALSNNA